MHKKYYNDQKENNDQTRAPKQTTDSLEIVVSMSRMIT